MKGRARQAISDKRLPEGAKKKKSSMNVRTAVLYKKTFTNLLDESVGLRGAYNLWIRGVTHYDSTQGISSLPASMPTYLTAGAPPPREPPRLLCSVCGYWGKYKCKKCAMAYCDRNCEGVHLETRCDRNVA